MAGKLRSFSTEKYGPFGRCWNFSDFFFLSHGLKEAATLSIVVASVWKSSGKESLDWSFPLLDLFLFFSERERGSVCVCVCVSERERERENKRILLRE